MSGHRLAMVLFRFVCLAIIPPPITASVACRPVTICPPLGGWRMVFLVLGSSKAPRALGSVSVRGPPERHASAVSFADAPRFARNALRPIGQNDQRRADERENQRDQELAQTPHLLCGAPPLDTPMGSGLSRTAHLRKVKAGLRQTL